MKKIIALGFLVIALSSCQNAVDTSKIADVNDLDAVLTVAYDNYVNMTTMETLVSEDEFKTDGNFKTLNADLNSDGQDDILVYSPLDVNYQFDVVTAITVKDGEFALIPSEIENILDYGQEFTIEDDLLVRKVDTGGTGVQVKLALVYIPKNDKIYFTNEPILLANESTFQEKTYKLESQRGDNWKDFIFDGKVVEAETQKIMSSAKAQYVLDVENNMYNIDVIESYEVAEEEYIYPRPKVDEADFVNTDFHKRVPNASYSEYIESLENRLLTGFSTETFGSREIDYSKHTAVYIAKYDSDNSHFADKKVISFEGDYISSVQVTIFGELEDVKVLCYNNYDDQNPQELILGNVLNTVLTVNAPFPHDNSRVDIVGKYYEGEGSYADVRIPLSPLGNLEESVIITF